jgi:hypothetical protein
VPSFNLKGRIARKSQGTSAEKGVMRMFVMPTREEIESIRKRLSLASTWRIGRSGYTGSSCEVMDMRKTLDRGKLEKIFESLDENEQFGLSFGLFPARLMKYELDNEESAALIGMSQRKTGVEF